MTPSAQDAAPERERLLEALAGVCADGGYAAATPALVSAAAGLPEGVFEHHFRTIHDAYLVLYSQTTERLIAAVTAQVQLCARAPVASGADGVADIENWRAQIDAGFTAVLEYLAARPEVATACVAEIYSIGPSAVALRDALLDRFMGLLEALRRAVGEPVPRLAVEMIVGGTYELIYTRVARGEADQLVRLMPDLRAAWLVPFLGSDGSEPA